MVGELLDDSGFTPVATTALPDHSVLVAAYSFSEYCLAPVNESRYNVNNDESEVTTHRIYKECSLSDGFLKDYDSQKSMDSRAEAISNTTDYSNLSKEYDSWILYIHTQMDVNLEHYDFPSDKSHNNNKSRAWWNTDLSNLGN